MKTYSHFIANFCWHVQQRIEIVHSEYIIVFIRLPPYSWCNHRSTTRHWICYLNNNNDQIYRFIVFSSEYNQALDIYVTIKITMIRFIALSLEYHEALDIYVTWLTIMIRVIVSSTIYMFWDTLHHYLPSPSKPVNWVHFETNTLQKHSPLSWFC